MTRKLKKATDTATETTASSETRRPGGPMDFITERGTLHNALRQLANVVDRKSTMPVLHRVCIRVVDKARVELVATDLNVYVVRSISARAYSEGATLIDAKRLHDVVKALPDGDVQCEIAPSSYPALRLTSGRIVARLDGMSARDFPKIPDVAGLSFATVPGKDLRNALERVTHSVCRDESRFYLNGIFLEDGVAVSTDGHRLAYTTTPLSLQHRSGMLVPLKGAKEIIKLLQDAPCQVAHTLTHFVVRQGDTTVITKLIDAQYPPYRQVIPTDFFGYATVDRDALVAAIKRALMLVCEGRGVRLLVGSTTLGVVTEHPDHGDVSETLDAAVDINSQVPVARGINPKYLAEALAEITTDKVTLCLGRSELDPMLVRPDTGTDYLEVIMPMRM